MELDEKGKKLLLESEGLKLKPYLDTKGVPTIAVGNTYYEDGTPVKMTDPSISKERALKLFEITAKKFSEKVSKLITSKVNQNQFNACVHFAYNIGTGPKGFAGSNVLKLINKNPNDPNIVTRLGFLGWLKNPELKGRRDKECKIYLGKL